MRFIWVVCVWVLMVGNICFGASVSDDNSGVNGQILVNNGTGTGHKGTWTDPIFLKGEDGANGVNGIDGVDGKNGEEGKGLKNQYKVGVEAVIVETTRTSWRMYYNRDMNNAVDEVGVKVVIYIGKSYSQKEIEKLQKQLKQLADRVEGRI